jgi:hypothetical protein
VPETDDVYIRYLLELAGSMVHRTGISQLTPRLGFRGERCLLGLIRIARNTRADQSGDLLSSDVAASERGNGLGKVVCVVQY